MERSAKGHKKRWGEGKTSLPEDVSGKDKSKKRVRDRSKETRQTVAKELNISDWKLRKSLEIDKKAAERQRRVSGISDNIAKPGT